MKKFQNLKKQLEQKDAELSELSTLAKEAVDKVKSYTTPSTPAKVVNPYTTSQAPTSNEPVSVNALKDALKAKFG